MAASPQDELEWQLRQRRDTQVSRTDDGGLLYGTNFTAASPESLRVPYELLSLECESHGGRLTLAAPAQTPAHPGGEDLEKSARDLNAHNVETLTKFEIAISTEPAFQFNA